MNKYKTVLWAAAVVVLAPLQMLGGAQVSNAAVPSKASDRVEDGIAGTRHNLTQNFTGGADVSGSMSAIRNNYGEVCVYCHTPHGANTVSAAGMPLWNRTVKTNTTYNLYDIPTTLGLMDAQAVTDPGPASLTCLSCHDGITAIDSVINMPGSMTSNVPNTQETSTSNDFLNLWPGGSATHMTLGTCADACHSGVGVFADIAPDFNNFVIGRVYNGETGTFESSGANVVDLTDDHPVGVLYPTTFGPGVDFNPNTVEEVGRYRYIENGTTGIGNGRADKHEVRLYQSGEGYEVECASCHDPHGVPDAGGIDFIPSFLRISNDGSALCLTCHIK